MVRTRVFAMYTPQLNPQPIGNVNVAVPGTPVQLTLTMQSITVGSGTMCAAADPVLFNKFSVITSTITHSGAGNTGNVYIGSATMVRATLAGVIVVLQPGTNWNIANNVSMNIYDLSKLYIDGDTAGDGVYGAIDTV